MDSYLFAAPYSHRGWGLLTAQGFSILGVGGYKKPKSKKQKSPQPLSLWLGLQVHCLRAGVAAHTLEPALKVCLQGQPVTHYRATARLAGQTGGGGPLY